MCKAHKEIKASCDKIEDIRYVAVTDKNEKNFQSGDIMHLPHVHNNFKLISNSLGVHIASFMYSLKGW